MGSRARVVATAFATCLITGATATSAPVRPVTERGWPIAVPAGDPIGDSAAGLIPALNGDVVAYSDAPDGATGSVVMRIAPGGAVRWRRALGPMCGNCVGRAGGAAARADGSFGPFGDDGRTWAVSARGAVVRGCEGVVRGDGTCIRESQYLDDPGIRAERGDAVLWRYLDPAPVDAWSGMEPMRRVVLTGSDTIAAALPAAATTGGARTTVLAGLGASAGDLRWRREVPGTWRLWLGTPDVLVATSPASAAVVMRPDGTERWSAPAGSDVLAVDARSRQLLVASRTPPPVVRGLDLLTGRTVWTGRPPWPVRVVGTWRGGAIIAPVSPGLNQVRGLDRRGRTRWIVGALTPAAAATGLSDGSIAVLTGDLTDTAVGLVTRHRLVNAPRPSRRAVSLVRVRQPGGRAALALRIATPAAMRVRIEVRVGHRRTRVVRTIAPTGVTLARLGTIAVPGSTMRISWSERGATRTARLRVGTDP